MKKKKGYEILQPDEWLRNVLYIYIRRMAFGSYIFMGHDSYRYKLLMLFTN